VVRPPALPDLRGHGLDPRGDPGLRARLARHLTVRQGLPTDPDRLLVTSGAQQALGLVAAVASGRAVSVVAGCPTYPGLAGAFSARRARLVPVAGDGPAGVDPAAAGRAARAAANPVVYVAPTGANPTGTILPAPRRAALLDACRSAGALVVEDLALADLVLAGPAAVPAPLGALDPDVVSIGSLSKLLWAGLRIGWIRAPEPLLPAFLAAKAAADLATGAASQALAAAVLDALDDRWFDDLRAALRTRADRLVAELRRRLPGWAVPDRPAAGLSLWVGLPVGDADAFTHTAARYGVTVANGSAMCLCGRHRRFIRLSFAEPIDVLDLAAERLAVAWEAHSADLAATPVP
jgi:DNA-binding transcriptional MocR family regulator